VGRQQCGNYYKLKTPAMKRISFLFVSLLIAITAASQGLFTTLTEKYASREGFSATNLTRDMFDLYLTKKQVEPNSPVYETLKKLDNVLVVSFSNLPFDKETANTSETTSPIQKSMLNYYKDQSFTLFKTENRNGEDLKVFLKKNGEKVTALSLVSATPTRLILVELNGDVDLASVSELNKALNLNGLENLYKINGQQEYPLSWQKYTDVYSNLPQVQQLELQKKYQQSMEDMNRLNGEKIREWTVQNKEMAEKYRQLAEKYGRHPVFLSAPGDTNMIYYIDGKRVDAKEINTINPDRIESIMINKPDKEHPAKKGEMKIKTKK